MTRITFTLVIIYVLFTLMATFVDGLGVFDYTETMPTTNFTSTAEKLMLTPGSSDYIPIISEATAVADFTLKSLGLVLEAVKNLLYCYPLFERYFGSGFATLAQGAIVAIIGIEFVGWRLNKELI